MVKMSPFASRTMKKGEISPGPYSATSRSNAWRDGKSGGKIVASGEEILARKKGVPPYTIFWDRTIDDLCAKKPRTPVRIGVM